MNRPYFFIITLLSIVTTFFIIVSPGSLFFELKNLFSSNILISLALKDNLIFGEVLGSIVIVIIYFSFEIKLKYNPKVVAKNVANVILLLVWIAVLTETVFITANPTRVVDWSNIFMTVDKSLFGVYPAFFMYDHYNIIFERIIVWSYNLIPGLIMLWTLFLLGTQRMEEFTLWSKRILLALVLSIPLWIMFPATQPSLMYVANIFNQKVPTDISVEISKGPPSQFINHYSLEYAKMWIDPKGQRLSVSNFPSMHVIWGFLLLLSVASIFKSKWLRLTLLILACANILGAIYVLQHYAVDAIAGMVMVGVIYILTKTKDNHRYLSEKL